MRSYYQCVTGLKLFRSQSPNEKRGVMEPDHPLIHQELKRKKVTKQLLKQECRERYPDDGYSYAQIFVAILGASNYAFASAHWIQKQADWLDAHIKAFEFFGGVPEIIEVHTAAARP